MTSAVETPSPADAAIAAAIDPPAGADQATGKPAAGKRWIALDWFRFTAVVLMVQGHTFTALVEEAVKPLKWYRHHNFVHGYTAPMFLFAGGLAFGVTTFRRWEDHTRFTKKSRQRIGRYLWMWLIGYALHLPTRDLWSLTSLAPEDLHKFARIDALQHIGATLIFCELLVMVLRNRRAVVATAAVLGTAVVMLGPWVWRIRVEQWLPTMLAAYVNNSAGSLFPLVPWSGFIFAGLVSAHLLGDPDRHGGGLGLGVRFGIAGALLMWVPVLIQRNGFDPFGPHNFWRTSPYFFAWRLGNVISLLAALCVVQHLYVKWKKDRPPGAINRIVSIMAAETLAIYVVHLMILYGSVLNRGLTEKWSLALSIPQATLLFLVFFVAMGFIGWIWFRAKKEQPEQTKWFRWSLAAMLLYVGLNSGG